jgi:hypothetical protein
MQTLIRRLPTENPTWGAPRIHGELLKLGFDVSACSVARYLRRHPRRRDSARRWAAFLANHREAIVACDFFTVATLTFQLLWCFFVIEHRRRAILHVNVTREPTATWVVQQLRDVFPGDGPHRYILLDHDSTFDGLVIAFLKATGLDPTRTGVQAPWQNGKDIASVAISRELVYSAAGRGFDYTQDAVLFPQVFDDLELVAIHRPPAPRTESAGGRCRSWAEFARPAGRVC